MTILYLMHTEDGPGQPSWYSDSLQVGQSGAVAYPGILFGGGGGSTDSVEDRGQRTGIWGR